MGVTFSCQFADFDDLDTHYLVRSISGKVIPNAAKAIELESFDCGKVILDLELEGSLSFGGRDLDPEVSRTMPQPLPEPHHLKHEAALRLQKTYKSFRTRRQLADCAVIPEQRWWKLLDFAELKRTSVSFFEIEKPKTAVSRWFRATTRAEKVGKGLSEDEKARKLTLQHWLEAIDPRHRYGHNLQLYYTHWHQCESKQPFFYRLDDGEGWNVNLERCPRSKLQQQCIKYLGPNLIRSGDIRWKVRASRAGKLLDTNEDGEDVKWIFVLCALNLLYVGQKRKGRFQHSSSLAGGATLSAGRLIVEAGILKAVWPYSGHYLPTEENFEACNFFWYTRLISVVCRELRMMKWKLVFRFVETNRHQSLARRRVMVRICIYRGGRGDCSPNSLLQIPARSDGHEVFFSPRCVESPTDGCETAEDSLLDSDSDTEFPISKENLFVEDEEEMPVPVVPKEKIIKRINSHKGMRFDNGFLHVLK